MRAINTLFIDSIQTEANANLEIGHSGRGYRIRFYRATLEARLEFKCPNAMRAIKECTFTAEGQDEDMNEAMRLAVENFTNGNSQIMMRYFADSPQARCRIDYSKVDALVVHLEEPWKTMFEDLFHNFNNPYSLELTKLNA